MLEWIRAQESVLWVLVIVSVVTFVASLILLPVILARIPADYFVPGKRRRRSVPRRHPVIHALRVVAKNIIGSIFILSGIAMLVLPGQGIIMIVAGIMIMDLPGKYALERRIIRQRAVIRGINWLRARLKQPPLEMPPQVKRGQE